MKSERIQRDIKRKEQCPCRRKKHVLIPAGMSGHGTVSEPHEDLGILKIRAEVVEVGKTKVIQSFWSS